MTDKQKKGLRAIVIGVGLIFLLIGVLTEVYPTMTGVIIALIIWIVGIPLLNVFKLNAEKGEGGPEKPVEPEKPARREPNTPPPPPTQ